MNIDIDRFLYDLARSGFNLQVDGDEFVLTGPKQGRARFVNTLRRHKPALLAALRDKPLDEASVFSRLKALVVANGDSESLLTGIPEETLRDCIGMSDESLQQVLSLYRDDACLRAGRVPEGYTEPAFCTHCGPVWLWPGVAVSAPRVNGWPTVKGCPWCFADRDYPRPAVTCGSCRHFLRDKINPEQGWGKCRLGKLKRTDMAYPNVRRECAAWRPLSD